MIAPIKLPLLLAAAWTAFAQPVKLPLENDKIAVTILQTGSTVFSIVLKDDPGKLNPLWQPGLRGGSGHFLCVDGFGSPSKEEMAAGQKYHGEAVQQVFQVVSQDGKSVKLKAHLPLLQENLTRTYRLGDGEQVLYADTELESLTAFDRPVVWGEHATIGAPFLEDLNTVVDLPVVHGQTRTFLPEQMKGRKYAPGRDFTWPMAPQADGKIVDIRFAPAEHDSIGHTTQLVEPTRKYGWATAINTRLNLIVGWIFKREDFPWIQSWENYPAAKEKMSRGLEFSTQPYDLPRREVVDMGRLFGVPTFKWLPAKSTLKTRWVMFYAHVPAGMKKVTDVKIENGKIEVLGDGGKRVTLSCRDMD